MGEDFDKTGIGFNLKHIRENNKELWNKYKNELIAGFPAVQEMDVVYMNELIPHVDGKVLLAFLRECMPKSLRDEIDESKKSCQDDGES
jgi:hypothetical protein